MQRILLKKVDILSFNNIPAIAEIIKPTHLPSGSNKKFDREDTKTPMIKGDKN